jgi:hypothetical protein
MDVEFKIKEKLSFDVPSSVTGNNIVTGNRGSSCQAISSGNRYKLSDISSEALEDMCDEFRVNVFKEAGKDFPNRGAE